jgi:hypothetical protein
VRTAKFDQNDFLAGLKFIDFPGVKSDVELVSELSPETCEAILDRGVEQIMTDISDTRWLKGMR